MPKVVVHTTADPEIQDSYPAITWEQEKMLVVYLTTDPEIKGSYLAVAFEQEKMLVV